MINVTKNKVIKALNYLGEYPKSSLKKDELIKLLEDLYNEENIVHLTYIINYSMYNLLKELMDANDGIYVGIEKEDEVNLLSNILMIVEPIKIETKFYIRFEDGMKEKIKKFINVKNEKIVKKHQEIADLIINIIETYGIMQVDYELANMLSNLLKKEIDVEELIELLEYNLDLRRKTVIPKSNVDLFLISNAIFDPQAIMDERRKRNLDYKAYTIEELKCKNRKALINCDEAKKILSFLKKKKFENPEGLVMAYIYDIMTSTEINIQSFMNVEGLDIKDLDEANEYIQLIMNLHNNIPHYALYGYSPNDLLELSRKEWERKKERVKKNKIGRNNLCPCRKRKKIQGLLFK